MMRKIDYETIATKQRMVKILLFFALLSMGAMLFPAHGKTQELPPLDAELQETELTPQEPKKEPAPIVGKSQIKDSVSGRDGRKADKRIQMEVVECFTEQEYVYTGGRYKNATITYRLLVPQNIRPGKKYPLVMWFHGIPDCDDGNMRQLVHMHSVLPWLTGEKGGDYFLCVPHCSGDNKSWFRSMVQDGKGDAAITITGEIMRDLIDKHPIDTKRITGCGISAGGYALWEFAAQHSDVMNSVALFSVTIPSQNTMTKLKDMPIWIFNNTGDKHMEIDKVRQDVAMWKAQGYKIHLTEYPLKNHLAWIPALEEGEALGWVLLQKKWGWFNPPPGRHTWLPVHSVSFVIPSSLGLLGLVLWQRRKKLREM